MFNFLPAGSGNRDKLPKNWRKYFIPGKEFAEGAKGAFLLSFRKKFGGVARQVGFSLAFKSLLVFLAILGTTNILAAYADSKNVSPADPLYPLKRYHESLVLAFAKQGDKPGLHVQFAEKRLEEVEMVSVAAAAQNGEGARERVKNGAGEQAMVRGLEDAAAGSLASAEKEEAISGDDGLPAFCRPLDKLFANSTSSHLKEALDSHPKILDKFKNRCAVYYDEERADNVANENSTSTYNLDKGDSSDAEGAHLIKNDSETTKVEGGNNKNDKNDVEE